MKEQSFSFSGGNYPKSIVGANAMALKKKITGEFNKIGIPNISRKIIPRKEHPEDGISSHQLNTIKNTKMSSLKSQNRGGKKRMLVALFFAILVNSSIQFVTTGRRPPCYNPFSYNFYNLQLNQNYKIEVDRLQIYYFNIGASSAEYLYNDFTQWEITESEKRFPGDNGKIIIKVTKIEKNADFDTIVVTVQEGGDFPTTSHEIDPNTRALNILMKNRYFPFHSFFKDAYIFQNWMSFYTGIILIGLLVRQIFFGFMFLSATLSRFLIFLVAGVFVNEGAYRSNYSEWGSSNYLELFLIAIVIGILVVIITNLNQILIYFVCGTISFLIWGIFSSKSDHYYEDSDIVDIGVLQFLSSVLVLAVSFVIAHFRPNHFKVWASALLSSFAIVLLIKGPHVRGTLSSIKDYISASLLIIGLSTAGVASIHYFVAKRLLKKHGEKLNKTLSIEKNSGLF